MRQFGWISNELCLMKKRHLQEFTVVYDSTYITIFKLQNYRNGEQISGCQGVG